VFAVSRAVDILESIKIPTYIGNLRATHVKLCKTIVKNEIKEHVIIREWKENEITDDGLLKVFTSGFGLAIHGSDPVSVILSYSGDLQYLTDCHIMAIDCISIRRMEDRESIFVFGSQTEDDDSCLEGSKVSLEYY
jgi:hypothetical protein